MVTRLSILRFASLLGCAALASGLGGCTSSNAIEFTNVSDSWLNVSFYVGASGTAPDAPQQLFADRRLQVEPGETAKYVLTQNPNYSRDTDPLVHIQVEPVSPSWQAAGRTYWLELLTHPPATIVATGSRDKLIFNTGAGAVTIIPEREVMRGRFQHKMMVTAPQDSESAK